MNIEELFDNGEKWKNKYKVKWCEHCDTGYIFCESCRNTSCNGGGCEICHSDFEEFHKTTKSSLYAYLNAEEQKIKDKIDLLRYLIINSINRNQKEIDINDFNARGELSEYENSLIKDGLFDNQLSHI